MPPAPVRTSAISSSAAAGANAGAVRKAVIASVSGASARRPANNEATVIDCHGEQLHLLPERALHWPVRRTLFVADVHLGKEHAFGRQGVAVPGGPSEATLDRLAALVHSTRVERLVVLGDLMHAAPAHGESWLASLSGFIDAHSALDLHVCAGNHDRVEGQGRLDARLRWHADPILDGPFVLQHEPGEDRRGYVLCGHVHPAFRIGQRRRDGLRVPAFWFRQGHAVLPAFGNFTGGHTIEPDRGDRVWVSGPERVVPVSARRR